MCGMLVDQLAWEPLLEASGVRPWDVTATEVEVLKLLCHIDNSKSAGPNESRLFF